MPSHGHAHLAECCDFVHAHPVFGDHSVLDAEDVDLLALDGLLRRRDALKDPDVEASEACADDDLVVAGDHVLGDDRKVGESGSEPVDVLAKAVAAAGSLP